MTETKLTTTIVESLDKFCDQQIAILNEWHLYAHVVEQDFVRHIAALTSQFYQTITGSSKTYAASNSTDQIESQILGDIAQYEAIKQALSKLHGYHLVELTGTAFEREQLSMVHDRAPKANYNRVTENLLRMDFYDKFQSMPQGTCGVFLFKMSEYTEVADANGLTFKAFEPTANIRTFAVFDNTQDAFAYKLAVE